MAQDNYTEDFLMQLAHRTVSLPAKLSAESVSQRLYPEAWSLTTLRAARQALATLLREQPQLEHPGDGVAALQLSTQRDALQLAVDRVHAHACRLYFAKPGWTRQYLENSGPGVWYFLASREVGLDETANSFRLRMDSRTPVPAVGAGSFEALQVLEDDELVQMSVNTLGFSRRRAPADYQGPASGLLKWARSRGVLIQRIECTPTVQ